MRGMESITKIKSDCLSGLTCCIRLRVPWDIKHTQRTRFRNCSNLLPAGGTEFFFFKTVCYRLALVAGWLNHPATVARHNNNSDNDNEHQLSYLIGFVYVSPSFTRLSIWEQVLCLTVHFIMFYRQSSALHNRNHVYTHTHTQHYVTLCNNSISSWTRILV
jgi:hypothetical protein